MSNFEIENEGLEAENQFKSETTQVQETPVVKERKGWVKKGDGFFTFANYDNLIAEYKTMIPKVDKWRSPTALKDPVDGQMYTFGVNIYDTGGTSVWSKLHTGSGSYGGAKKAWYKTVGIIEGDAGQVETLLAAGETESGISYKYANTFQTKKIVQNQDGTKSMEDKIIHILLKQKRIEYGS